MSKKSWMSLENRMIHQHDEVCFSFNFSFFFSLSVRRDRWNRRRIVQNRRKERLNFIDCYSSSSVLLTPDWISIKLISEATRVRFRIRFFPFDTPVQSIQLNNGKSDQSEFLFSPFRYPIFFLVDEPEWRRMCDVFCFFFIAYCQGHPHHRWDEAGRRKKRHFRIEAQLQRRRVRETKHSILPFNFISSITEKKKSLQLLERFPLKTHPMSCLSSTFSVSLSILSM